MEIVLLLLAGVVVAGYLEKRKRDSVRRREEAAAGVVLSFLDLRLTRSELLVGADRARYSLSGSAARLKITSNVLLDSRPGGKKYGEREGTLTISGMGVTLSRPVDDARCSRAKQFEIVFNDLAATVIVDPIGLEE